MIATTGQELLVRIPDLHTDAPVSQDPNGVALGSVFVPKKPNGRRNAWTHSIDRFGDEFSSIRFSWSL